MATAKKSAAKKSAPSKSASKVATKSAPAKAAAKTAAKGATNGAAKKAAAKTGAARSPNAAFMKPMKPSADLAAVVGSESQPRSQITSRVWDYIKKHNLQDATNRRQINADANLRKVFGGKANVTMFEMTKLVNGHLSDG